MRQEVKDSFDEFSPITGEHAVLVEDSFRLDLSSGYQNLKEHWNVKNEDIIKAVEEQLPAYILPFKFVDLDGEVWYPVLAFKHTAVLFPVADKEQGFIWAISKVEPLKNKEDINTHYVVNLPINVGGKEELGLFKVENDPYARFKKTDFEQAYDLYNSIGEDEK